MGTDGGMVIHKDECIKLPAVDVPVIDTVGAGDSFNAGYVYGFLTGLSPKDCLRAALFCGSMNTTKTGGTAGQPYYAQLDAYLKHGHL
jgi:sugar/nucleoside kinase (ribokinase family)